MSAITRKLFAAIDDVERAELALQHVRPQGLAALARAAAGAQQASAEIHTWLADARRDISTVAAVRAKLKPRSKDARLLARVEDVIRGQVFEGERLATKAAAQGLRYSLWLANELEHDTRREGINAAFAQMETQLEASERLRRAMTAKLSKVATMPKP